MDMKIAKTQDDLNACMDLRRAVFVIEQGFSEDSEFDEIDQTCTHILLHDGDTPIGTARIFRVNGTGKIGRICVAKSHRGRKLGQALVQFALDEFAKDPQLTQAYLSAQTYALPFYQSLGFESQGDEYPDEHVPHIDMFKSLQ